MAVSSPAEKIRQNSNKELVSGSILYGKPYIIKLTANLSQGAGK